MMNEVEKAYSINHTYDGRDSVLNKINKKNMATLLIKVGDPYRNIFTSEFLLVDIIKFLSSINK